MFLAFADRAWRPPRQVRCYAASVSQPRIYPGKKMPRNYSIRKTFLCNQYTGLLNRGSPLLFFNHNNFSAQQLTKLRRDIAAINASSPSPSRGGELSTGPTPLTSPAPPEFIVIRTGILGVALRDHLGGLTPKQKRSLIKLFTPGALAVLALPTLDPPQLAQLLRVLERAVPPKPAPGTKTDSQRGGGGVVVENPTPGRRPKRVRPDLPPELELKGALIDGRLLVRDQVKDVSRLAGLQMLRAQILGLIGGPAAQLARVLGEAGGGQLARTLQGFQKGLEMGTDSSAGDNNNNSGGRQ